MPQPISATRQPGFNPHASNNSRDAGLKMLSITRSRAAAGSPAASM
jgi:hypothetical protein